MVPTEPHPIDVYSRVRDELIGALDTLDDAAASQPVPACPLWTVKDVVAHLVGLNAEKLAGVPGSLGSDEATVRQVASRSSSTLAEVVGEWRSLAEPLRALLADQQAIATAFLADLVIHVYDLAEVLHQRTAEAEAATPMSAQRYVRPLQERVADRIGVALHVDLADGTHWPAPTGDDDQRVVLRATPHEFLRGVTGRRTRAEVESMDWSADPTAILDRAWNQYGPFRRPDGSVRPGA